MKIKSYILLLFFFTAALMSCDDQDDAKGTVRLSITDAPLDNPDITAVNLAVLRIDIKGPSGWEVLEDFEEPLNVNLLEYREGNSLLLTEEEITAGTYREIRLVLDIAEKEGGDAANRGTYIQYTDGSKEPLFVPSGASSGYKVKGEFDIPVGGVTGLTIDFDARRAVVKAGNSGKFILKPVTRLVEDDDVAIIRGTVMTETEYTSLRVFAYTQGSFDESEVVAEDGSVEFPNAITSGNVRDDGTFTLAFMHSGTYDLVIAAYDENNAFTEIISVVEAVELAPGEIKQLEADLP